MKIYDDRHHNYYATDNFLKNLIPIEINTLEDYLNTTLVILPLFGVNALVPRRFDELKSIPPSELVYGDLLRDEPIDLPFLKNLTHSQIMIAVAMTFEGSPAFEFEDLLEEMKYVCRIHVSHFDDDGNTTYRLRYGIVFNDNSPSLAIIHTISDDMITDVEVYSFKDI